MYKDNPAMYIEIVGAGGYQGHDLVVTLLVPKK
jgi:hypothetical protein